MDRRPRAMRAGRIHGTRRFVDATVRRGKDHSVASVPGLSSAISLSNSPPATTTALKMGEQGREGKRGMDKGRRGRVVCASVLFFPLSLWRAWIAGCRMCLCSHVRRVWGGGRVRVLQQHIHLFILRNLVAALPQKQPIKSARCDSLGGIVSTY